MTNRYFNRELSWLEFNQRVLEEAKREDLPLLERLKFLAISGSNLDEFFQVRIGGLSELHREDDSTLDLSGMTVEQQLLSCKKRADEMVAEQYELLSEELLPALREEGLRFLDLSTLQRSELSEFHDDVVENVLPLLTPIAVQYEETLLPIPSLQLCVICALKGEGAEVRYAFIPVPTNLSRFYSYRETPEEKTVILLEEIVMHLLPEMFPNEQILACSVFRVTKNSDIVLEDEEARDLAGEMKEVLTKRRFGNVVRVEFPSGVAQELETVVAHSTGASLRTITETDGPLALAEFFALCVTPGFTKLKFPLWKAVDSPQFPPDVSIFDTLDQKSVLLLHPYESFQPVVRLLEEAAEDPDTLAIKQVLYRTASKSTIIEALKKAALNGKQVTVLVELKARFDEARNLLRAEELQRAGVQVVYGVKGYKTHAKATLVVRRQAGRIKRYLHLGTGNYNETTANLYTDISYLSSNHALGVDVSLFFNMLTGRSKMTRFYKVRPAPTHMKSHLLELIALEAEQATEGKPARILAKMNSLQDPVIIDALYEASQAGVQIDLNVRGICCLRPGVEGLSETIRVVSIIDRYLEHARVFAFDLKGQQRVFISSADWMVRNLDKRLELLVPIDEPTYKKQLIAYLKASFHDNTNAYLLNSKGESIKRTRGEEAPFRFQEHFHQKILQRKVLSEQDHSQSYVPHIAGDYDSFVI